MQKEYIRFVAKRLLNEIRGLENKVGISCTNIDPSIMSPILKEWFDNKQNKKTYMSAIENELLLIKNENMKHVVFQKGKTTFITKMDCNGICKQ